MYKDLLNTTKTIAVIGASSDGTRASNGIMRMLQGLGYRCIPINPKEAEILGEKCYASLADIPSDIQIDIVDVFRRPEHTPDVAAAAVARGHVKCLWLQTGVVNDNAMKIARDGGLMAVQDECLGVVARLNK
jgi:predicted CoA-binding protein